VIELEKQQKLLECKQAEQKQQKLAKEKRRARGLFLKCQLAPESMKMANQKNTSATAVVAITHEKDDCMIRIEEDGSFWYTAGLPLGLYNKLQQNQRNPPTYISLGTNQDYYVKFANGKSDWVGIDETIIEEMQEPSDIVKCVAFGEGSYRLYGSYKRPQIVVFEDGSWVLDELPSEFVEKLTDFDAPDLEWASLGPSGEWFFKTIDGHVEWGGGCDDFNEEIRNIKKSRIRRIFFGSNAQYIIRYT